MSCRGVTLQTRAASAAESRSRRMTSPPLAIRTNASASGPSGSPKCASPIRTGARAAVTEGAIVSLAAGRVNNRNRWLIQDQDREDWRLAGSPPAPARWRFYHLPNRHTHRDVIAPEPAGGDIGPLPGHLHGDRLAGLVPDVADGGLHRGVPTGPGGAVRLDQPDDRCGGWRWAAGGASGPWAGSPQGRTP